MEDGPADAAGATPASLPDQVLYGAATQQVGHLFATAPALPEGCIAKVREVRELLCHSTVPCLSMPFMSAVFMTFMHVQVPSQTP